MYPLLLQIGPITIFSLWISIAIGLFAALIVASKLTKKARLHVGFLADNSLAIFFGSIIMSRIFFVIKNSYLYFSDFHFSSFLQLFYIWDKGLSPWGAVVGLIASLVYFAYMKKENIQKWLDVTSVSLLSAITFMHIGAFLDGRNYGRGTELPWGVIIESSIYAVPIHPTQIYAAFYSGLLTVILYYVFQHRLAIQSGNISIFALTAYSFFKFLEEFLRGDESSIIFGLREAQIYALLGLATGIYFIVRRKIFTRKYHGND